MRSELELMGRNVDRAIADDIARARADGSLADSAESAWGNAAIPGFGIGRPTRAPDLDPAVQSVEVADPAEHEAAMEQHRIRDDALVLAHGQSGTFAVYRGDVAAATGYHDPAFILGLVGIAMSIFCATALGVMLSMSRAST
jgi:hypothetical protein